MILDFQTVQSAYHLQRGLLNKHEILDFSYSAPRVFSVINGVCECVYIYTYMCVCVCVQRERENSIRQLKSPNPSSMKRYY